MEKDIIMASNLGFYQLLLVALVLIFLMIHLWWPDHSRAILHRPFKPDKPRRKRSKEPQPFTGLLHKPLCEACAHGAEARRKAPGSPPPVVTFTRGRRRTVDTRPLLSRARLFLPWLARPRQHPLEWSSRQPALAPAAMRLLPG